jgi:hypothetical protein
MARGDLVNAELKQGISELTKQWRELNSAYRDFTKKKLAFAQRVAKLWHRAKKLDETSFGENNENYLRDELRVLIQSDSKSSLSKWVSIGQNAAALLPYAKSLPPQRDSLYALSIATERKQPIHHWISKGSLTSESTVRDVLKLTSSMKSKKVPSSRLMEVLKISFPEDDAVEQFSRFRVELERFLDERGISYSYCGVFARYETDLQKYQDKLSKHHLRLLKRYVTEKIRERVEYNYRQVRGDFHSKKVSFPSKLKELKLAIEEVDARNCVDTTELEDLYKRMELDEDGDWNEKVAEFFHEALAQCPVPRSVELLSSVGESAEEKSDEISLPSKKRRRIDFSDVKVL